MKHFYKKICLLAGFIGLLASASWAQTRVTGRVLDEAAGEAVIGATVLEKGTSNGTITDYDGKFAITVKDLKATLVINYTGYTSKDVPLNGQTTIEVRLTEDEGILEEIVVVGYGVQRKSDLTGAVGIVKAKELERVPTASLEQALQGKLAGVYISPASGEPGAGATIRIRGTGTLNNASPLYVVDGMLLDDISFLNPQDVASVEVLKDASSTAIYGNRGANGVIIITTKRGLTDTKASFTLNTYYGTQQIAKKLPLANASQFAEMYNELKGNNYYPDPAALREGTDWQDVIFRDAPMANVQLGVGGLWKKLNYNLSGNMFDQQGIMEETSFRRYTGRVNLEYPVLKSLRVGTNMAYSNYKYNTVGGGVLGGMYRMPPVFAARDSTGDFTDPTFFGQSIGNPAADLFYKNDQYSRVNRWVGSVYANWTFLKHFTFRTNYGFDRRRDYFYGFEPVFMVSSSQLNNEERTARDTAKIQNWLWENTLTFDKTWDILRLNVLAGQTAQEYTFNKRRTINEILQPNGEENSDWAMLSYLGRVNATFYDRYLLTASVRADGSSRFNKKNRWGYFPSVAAGWNVSQEPFMRGFKLFDRLKLRASWGITGNDKIQNYPSLGIITPELYGAFNDTIQSGATLTNYANADVRWETTEQTDFGVEFGLFKGKFTAEIDWFRRYTYDILGDLPIPDYVGSGSNPFVNAAQVENVGWDFTVNWREVKRKFSYNLGVTVSPIENKVLKLNDGKSEIFEARTGQGDFATRTVVGLPIGAFYGYQVAGVFQNQEEIDSSPKFGNEKPGDFRFADLNGDGKLSADDRTYLGSPIPTLIYGLNAGFEAFGFDLAVDFFGVKGNKVVNAKAVSRFDTPNWETIWYDNHWTGEGTSNSVPRVTNGGHNYRMSDFLVEDGAFFRLRTVAVGYSLPTKWLDHAHIRDARLYASGTNLWTKQAYSGYTPEFPNDSVFKAGMDFLNYPMAKTILFGLNVTF
ncbi:MAG TPA: TonB-dependent receptor [Saprospiraceae bacterium]|nr:TonB-dependent receptor [Saprospiraceae bacterium]